MDGVETLCRQLALERKCRLQQIFFKLGSGRFLSTWRDRTSASVMGNVMTHRPRKTHSSICHESKCPTSQTSNRKSGFRRLAARARTFFFAHHIRSCSVPISARLRHFSHHQQRHNHHHQQANRQCCSCSCRRCCNFAQQPAAFTSESAE